MGRSYDPSLSEFCLQPAQEETEADTGLEGQVAGVVCRMGRKGGAVLHGFALPSLELHAAWQVRLCAFKCC